MRKNFAICAQSYIPKGLEYTEDSLKVDSGGDLDYSLGDYREAIGYQAADGSLLFFQTKEGFYYELSGQQLLAAGTLEEALDHYNSSHKTEYELPPDTEASADTETTSDTEASTGTDITPDTESVSGTEATSGENVTYLGTASSPNMLTVQENLRILILSLDTQKEFSEVTLSYSAVKNSQMNSSGFLDNEFSISYSVSPLDVNLVRSCTSAARVNSYGIEIVVCEGTGESVNMTTQEKYEKAVRLTGAEFALYKLSNTYDGNYIEENGITEDIQTTESSDSTDIQYYYDKEVDRTYEYTYFRNLVVNDKGQIAVGGLEATGYLLMQTIYPVGRTLSDTSLVIAEDTWSDETAMESTCLFRVLWLDYETVYLPGTGSAGARDCYIAGLAVLLCVLVSYLDYNGLLANIFVKKSRKKQKK